MIAAPARRGMQGSVSLCAAWTRPTAAGWLLALAGVLAVLLNGASAPAQEPTGAESAAQAAAEAVAPAPARPPAPPASPPAPALSPAEAAAKAAAEAPMREVPLYEEDPYDLITLKNHEGEPPLKVEPLDLPDRRIPSYLRPNYTLKVVLWDEPEKKYELRWSSVERIDLFEQLVLAKAKELVEAGQREIAYDYFQWLHAKDPKMPGLREAVAEYLYREAGIQSTKGNHYGALAILFNLADYDRTFPKLANALGITEEKLLEKYDSEGNYEGARALLAGLANRFPDHPTVKKWESDLRDRATRQLTAARDAAARGAFREADRAMQQVTLYWPELPGAKDLRNLLHRRYCRVGVGVAEPATTVDPRHRRNWATRRSSRLVYRTLTEFLGAGSEGGNYGCPVGQIEIEPLQRRLWIQVRPGQRWATGNETLRGADVARKLLAMAEPLDPQFEPAWSELFAGAVVHDVFRVEIAMRRSHVRPDALLQTTLAPYNPTGKPASGSPPNGPYLVDETNDEGAIYVHNSRYIGASASQPREIVEQCFQDPRAAIRALRDGRVKVLDRLSPWTLQEFRSMDNVVVAPYAAPLVHCLLPNRTRKLMKDKVFRRAIVYGIHRQAILSHLMGENAIPGCAVISGPFLQGASYDDPLGYAYDVNIQPRPYDPGLAMMLTTYVTDLLAKDEADAADRAGKKGAPPPTQPKPQPAKPLAGKNDLRKQEAPIVARLTLAHPAHEIARTACQKIKDQLRIVGIDVTLRELPPGPCEKMPEDADLLYAELPMWEPVIDSRALLGAEGPTGESSAYMNLVLNKLRDATDWQQVRPLLRQIHRIVHDDVAIIPLWQLVDHFAYHTSLRGIGDRPVSLYENVEQWQLDPDAKQR